MGNDKKIKTDKKSLVDVIIASNVDLSKEGKGILRYLGHKSEALDLDSIIDYMKDHGYKDLDKSTAMEELDKLINVGFARSKTTGRGDNREEKFYLARGVGGGGRRRRYEQGRGPVYDASRYIKRLFGSVFVLIGVGFMIYSLTGITGAVISSPEFVIPGFVFALALFVIGGMLLINTFKKKK